MELTKQKKEAANAALERAMQPSNPLDYESNKIIGLGNIHRNGDDTLSVPVFDTSLLLGELNYYDPNALRQKMESESKTRPTSEQFRQLVENLRGRQDFVRHRQVVTEQLAWLGCSSSEYDQLVQGYALLRGSDKESVDFLKAVENLICYEEYFGY